MARSLAWLGYSPETTLAFEVQGGISSNRSSKDLFETSAGLSHLRTIRLPLVAGLAGFSGVSYSSSAILFLVKLKLVSVVLKLVIALHRFQDRRIGLFLLDYLGVYPASADNPNLLFAGAIAGLIPGGDGRIHRPSFNLKWSRLSRTKIK